MAEKSQNSSSPANQTTVEDYAESKTAGYSSVGNVPSKTSSEKGGDDEEAASSDHNPSSVANIPATRLLLNDPGTEIKGPKSDDAPKRANTTLNGNIGSEPNGNIDGCTNKDMAGEVGKHTEDQEYGHVNGELNGQTQSETNDHRRTEWNSQSGSHERRGLCEQGHYGP